MPERLSRLYRGRRIIVYRLGNEWHAVVHHPHGGIAEKDIVGRTILEAFAKAEWAIERRLAFRPPADQRRVS
jgi:hypothetical protein